MRRQIEDIKRERSQRMVAMLAVAALQFIAANVAGFALSVAFPRMDPDVNHAFFVFVAGFAYFGGIIALGFLAYGARWLKGEPAHGPQSVLAFVGVFGTLMVALLRDAVRTASPYFFVAMVLGIVGFHLGGLFSRGR